MEAPSSFVDICSVLGELIHLTPTEKPIDFYNFIIRLINDANDLNVHMLTRKMKPCTLTLETNNFEHAQIYRDSALLATIGKKTEHPGYFTCQFGKLEAMAQILRPQDLEDDIQPIFVRGMLKHVLIYLQYEMERDKSIDVMCIPKVYGFIRTTNPQFPFVLISEYIPLSLNEVLRQPTADYKNDLEICTQLILDYLTLVGSFRAFSHNNFHPDNIRVRRLSAPTTYTMKLNNKFAFSLTTIYQTFFTNFSATSIYIAHEDIETDSPNYLFSKCTHTQDLHTLLDIMCSPHLNCNDMLCKFVKPLHKSYPTYLISDILKAFVTELNTTRMDRYNGLINFGLLQIQDKLVQYLKPKPAVTGEQLCIVLDHILTNPYTDGPIMELVNLLVPCELRLSGTTAVDSIVTFGKDYEGKPITIAKISTSLVQHGYGHILYCKYKDTDAIAKIPFTNPVKSNNRNLIKNSVYMFVRETLINLLLMLFIDKQKECFGTDPGFVCLPAVYGFFPTNDQAYPFVLISERIPITISNVFDLYNDDLYGYYVGLGLCVQVIYGLLFLQTTLNAFAHNDLHLGNVMLKPLPAPATATIKLPDGTSITMVILYDIYFIDFGLSCIDFGKCRKQLDMPHARILHARPQSGFTECPQASGDIWEFLYRVSMVNPRYEKLVQSFVSRNHAGLIHDLIKEREKTRLAGGKDAQQWDQRVAVQA